MKSSPLTPFLVFRSDLSSSSFKVNLGCISVGLPFPVKVLQLLTASDTHLLALALGAETFLKRRGKSGEFF